MIGPSIGDSKYAALTLAIASTLYLLFNTSVEAWMFLGGVWSGVGLTLFGQWIARQDSVQNPGIAASPKEDNDGSE